MIRFLFPTSRRPWLMLVLALLWWPLGLCLAVLTIAVLAVAILFVPWWVLTRSGRIYTD